MVEKLSPSADGSSQPAASVAAPSTSRTACFATFAVASVSVIVDAVPTVGVTPDGKEMPGSVPSRVYATFAVEQPEALSAASACLARKVTAPSVVSAVASTVTL